MLPVTVALNRTTSSSVAGDGDAARLTLIGVDGWMLMLTTPVPLLSSAAVTVTLAVLSPLDV